MVLRPEYLGELGQQQYYWCPGSLCHQVIRSYKLTFYDTWIPGPWFNIKMSSYQYRKSYCGDKTVVRSSYLHNGISYTGKISLYWIRAQPSMRNISMTCTISNEKWQKWAIYFHVCWNKFCMQKVNFFLKYGAAFLGWKDTCQSQSGVSLSLHLGSKMKIYLWPQKQ